MRLHVSHLYHDGQAPEDGPQQLYIWRSTRIELGFELKASDHAIHQVMPMLKDHRACEGPDIVEKGLTSHKRLPQQRLLVITPLHHGMEKQGEQVEAEQQRREIVLAMTKSMLDMVALGCDHVGVVVCDLPAPTTRWCDLRDVGSAPALSGEQAVVSEWRARFGMDRGDLQPRHCPGTWATA